MEWIFLCSLQIWNPELVTFLYSEFQTKVVAWNFSVKRFLYKKEKTYDSVVFGKVSDLFI